MPFPIYKLIGSLAEPMNLFAVLLFFAMLFVCLPWEGARKFGKRLGMLLALLLLLLAALPLGQWALLPLENAYAGAKLPEKVDGIVFLTTDEDPVTTEARGVTISGYAGQRHIALARLAKRYPKARILVVGTTAPFTPSEKVTTKSLMQDNFDQLGIPRDRVEFETKSRTTHENAIMAKELVKPKEGQTWILMTTASHMPRAVLCFQKEGWKVWPHSADYLTAPTFTRPHGLTALRQIRFLDRALHEYVGLLTYRLAGWTKSLW